VGRVRDRSHAIPLIAIAMFFAHDSYYVLNYDYWINTIDHPFFKANLIAMAIFACLELVVIWQIITYSRKEVGARRGWLQAFFSYVAIQAGVYIMFLWFRSMMGDPLYLECFAISIVFSNLFNIPMLMRRGSRKGQSLVIAWAVAIQTGPVGFFMVHPFLGPYFMQPTWFAAGIANTVLAFDTSGCCIGLPAIPRRRHAGSARQGQTGWRTGRCIEQDEMNARQCSARATRVIRAAGTALGAPGVLTFLRAHHAAQETKVTSKKWNAFEAEAALDPPLPIVDPHHHIWGPKFDNALFKPYDIDELCADVVDSGHNIVATVLVDSHAQHHTDGPPALRPVGGNGLCRAGVEAGRRALGRQGRRAVRSNGPACRPVSRRRRRGSAGCTCRSFFSLSRHPHMLAFHPSLRRSTAAPRPASRSGANSAKASPSSPAGVSASRPGPLQTQLDEVIDLARGYPEAPIVLNHLGGPLAVGPFAGKREEGFRAWQASMAQLAQCPNVTVKLGGIYVVQTEPANIGFPPKPITSEQFADIHRDYLLAAIDLFLAGPLHVREQLPGRHALYLRTTTCGTGTSASQRDSRRTSGAELFSGVARRVYRIS
jgi:hypothetical protein